MFAAVFAGGATKALFVTCRRKNFTVFSGFTTAARPVKGRPCRTCRPVAPFGTKNTIRMGRINFISICLAQLVVVETARARQAPISCIPARRITEKFTHGTIVCIARCRRGFACVDFTLTVLFAPSPDVARYTDRSRCGVPDRCGCIHVSARRARVRYAFFACRGGLVLVAVCGAAVAQCSGIGSYCKRFTGRADIDVCAPGRAGVAC